MKANIRVIGGDELVIPATTWQTDKLNEQPVQKRTSLTAVLKAYRLADSSRFALNNVCAPTTNMSHRRK